MPESNAYEQQQKLAPSITVDIHPTIATSPPVKEVDTAQDEMEKTLGLKITGGVDFKMPITIFHASFTLPSCCCFSWRELLQVKDDSKAKRVGLKLGDAIASIDEKQTKEMTLKEANEALLHASENIRSFKLGVIR